MTDGNSTLQLPFRPKARILQLLGEELIGSSRLAVFELVKNAYDADASRVDVYLEKIRSQNPQIVVEDDGDGMSLETIRDIWLVPAHEHRGVQRRELRRTAKNRLPLGEKGLGRFAVHKLGDRITLITRAKGRRECVVEINWQTIIDQPFLSDANVLVTEREPELFTDGRTGTRITISALKDRTWTRGDARRLLRQITSISSPFAERSDEFVATLHIPEYPEWLANVPDMGSLLERAPWHFRFTLDRGVFTWSYEFRGVPGLKVERRVETASDRPLQIVQRKLFDDFGVPLPRGISEKLVATEEMTAGVGPVKGEFFVYDRDRDIIGRLGDSQLIQNILDEQGGVRVYRDGIRVYNYGEPGDDWLGLDLRRVNTPTRNVSRNIILGYIDLSLEHSHALVEKTNREGFVESAAFERFRAIVLGALVTFEIERKIDKDRIRSLTQKSRDAETERMQKPLLQLRDGLRRHRLEKELGPYVDKIEHDYNEMRESMLRSGLSGMNLAIVFHEVERGVRVLHDAVRDGMEAGQLEIQARELVRVLDGFSELLRKGQKTRNSLKRLLREARNINRVRFRSHNVRLVCPAIEDDAPDVESVFVFGLVLGALNNLIDNALYWMQVRWPDDSPDARSPRAIYLNISRDIGDGPAIVMADTGPGFQDLPEDVVRPFFTRRPEGMGLGLYYTNLVMQLNDGDLVFPDREDASVPDGFDGAVLALQFKDIE